MRIAVDASSLAINPFSGLSQVVHSLLRHLPAAGAGNQFISYVNFFRKHAAGKDIFCPGVTPHYFRFPRRLMAGWWRFGWPPVDSFLPETDLFHSLHIQVPPTRKIKTVLTVHDCRYLALPALYDPREVETYRREMKRFLERVDMVAVVSEFTRQELVSHFSFPEDRIRVIYNGFDPLRPSESGCNRILDAEAPSQPYLLYIGVLDPRKNLDRLIEALARCRQAADDFPDLVIAGVSPGKWHGSKYALKAKRSGVFDHIHLRGVVGRDILMNLLQKACGLCYPSLYEGFGFPPLEAMSLSVPVLAGKGSSISEVTGPAACLVDPMNVDDMAQGLRRIVFDDDYRRGLIERGHRQIKKFSWKKAAAEYMDLYDTVMKG